MDFPAALAVLVAVFLYFCQLLKQYMQFSEEMSLMRERLARYESVSKDITTLAVAQIEQNVVLRETLERISDAVGPDLPRDIPGDGLQGVSKTRTQGPG